MNTATLLAVLFGGIYRQPIPMFTSSYSYLKDTFSDADDTLLTDHIMNTGAGWTGQTIPKISGNKATAVTSMNHLCTVTDAGMADCVLTVGINGSLYNSTTNYNFPSLVLRYTDDANFYMVEINANVLMLYRRQTTTFTSVATYAGTYTDGVTYPIKVVLNGQTIDIYTDGILRIHYTTAALNLTATKFGITGLRGGTPVHEATWDNFIVTPLTSLPVINQRDFTKLVYYGGNPTIPYGAGAYNANASDTVYATLAQKIGSTYYMVTQGDATGFQFHYFALYTSTDLVNWTPYAGNPVLTAGAGGGLDAGYLAHPSIIKIGATWYMYYSAAPSAGQYRIWLATSPDLVTWTRYQVDSIYTGPTALGGAYSPCVIKIGATYFMYYWNNGASYLNCMEYATSADGLTWTYQGTALGRNPEDWDYGYVRIGFDPWVIQNKNGVYEMVYSIYVTDTPITQIFGYATSPDGVYWEKRPGLILSPSGIAGRFDESYVGDLVLLEVAGRLYLYYAGVGPDNRPQGGVAWLNTV